MTRRRVILLVLTLLLAAGTVTYLCLPEEPRYQGRTLSSWLERGTRDSIYLVMLSGEEPSEDFEETRTAVRAIGTNALPFLIEWSLAHDSDAKENTVDWINEHLPNRYYVWSAAKRRYAAEIGFGMLAGEAKPAWPVFVQWTFAKDPVLRSTGCDGLVDTKADQAILLPVFLRMIKDSDQMVRYRAAIQFRGQYPQAAEAAGVYDLFPILRPGPAVPSITNQPPPNK